MTQKKGTKEHATQKWNDAKQCKNETTQKQNHKQTQIKTKQKQKKEKSWLECLTGVPFL